MRYTLIAVFAMLVACTSAHRDDEALDRLSVPQRSIYYWRTVFALDSTERAFLVEHNVQRMYVRYFDVVQRGDDAMPNATIRFGEPIPTGIDIVPTVFIMENCLPHIDQHKQELVDRILKINATNDIGNVHEVQIDCDWTARSQERYYALLAWMREALQAQGIALSATIRLHQLAMAPPPVDYGVLMMYNTGSLSATNGHNPILDYRDAYPYLKHLGNYQLPLTAAWPCYAWNLLYSDNTFKAIMYNSRLSDTTTYRRVSPGRYVVLRNSMVAEPNSDGSDATWANVGDSIITMQPQASEILKIVEATSEQRPGLNKRVIMYSLDTKNIKLYDNNYFKAIYTR